MRYVYFAVEGPHDVEFVARFLKLQGLKRIQHKDQLAPFSGLEKPSRCRSRTTAGSTERPSSSHG